MGHHLNNSPLGKETKYKSDYDPHLLFPIPRQPKREEIGIKNLPFTGHDIWNAYEVSWLNNKGKPIAAIAIITVPCTSPNIFESKSAKLYLNSFNSSRFNSIEEVRSILAKDLSAATGSEVKVELNKLSDSSPEIHNGFEAKLLDDQDIECTEYHTNPRLLKTHAEHASETLYSDLLKSNCLITNQPDWGSVYIKYTGKKIDHESLLRYIVSFRDHNEFHEQCVERIFQDIMKQCHPEELTVYARYTRRGGLDINPFRTNCNENLNNIRLVRQ